MVKHASPPALHFLPRPLPSSLPSSYTEEAKHPFQKDSQKNRLRLLTLLLLTLLLPLDVPMPPSLLDFEHLRQIHPSNHLLPNLILFKLVDRSVLDSRFDMMMMVLLLRRDLLRVKSRDGGDVSMEVGSVRDFGRGLDFGGHGLVVEEGRSGFDGDGLRERERGREEEGGESELRL